MDKADANAEVAVVSGRGAAFDALAKAVAGLRNATHASMVAAPAPVHGPAPDAALTACADAGSYAADDALLRTVAVATAVETTLMAPNADGPLQRLLSSPLPVCFKRQPGPGTSAIRHRLTPQEVFLWSDADPENPFAGSLMDAITSHIRKADSLYKLQTPLGGVLPHAPSYGDNAAEVASHLYIAVGASLLQPLAEAAGADLQFQDVEWRHEYTTGLDSDVPLLKDTVGTGGLMRADRLLLLNVDPHSPSAVAASAVAEREEGRLAAAPEVADGSGGGGSGAGPGSSGGSGAGEAGGSATPTAQGPSTSCAVLGVVEQPGALMQGPHEPVELLAAWCDPTRRQHVRAQAVIRQLFTYLQAYRVAYGFISCWYGTWLVYCPPDKRERLYVSPPLLPAASSPGADGKPSATVLGALAWLQLQGLQFLCSGRLVARHPSEEEGPAKANAEPDGSGGGNGSRLHDDGSAGGSGGPDDRGPSVPLPTSLAGAEGECLQPRRDAVAEKPASEAAAAAAAPSAPPHGAPARLRFMGELEREGNATVFRGTCNGAPALLRVYAWDQWGRQGHMREVQAYRALAAVQGVIVQEALATGLLPYDIRFIALRPVEGCRQLASCPRPLPEDVKHAAVEALRAAHAACPGFLHGDIRLENYLVLPLPPSGADEGAAEAAPPPSALEAGGGGAVRCMLYDLSNSRLDGNERQQQQERRQLRQLLGLRVRAR